MLNEILLKAETEDCFMLGVKLRLFHHKLYIEEVPVGENNRKFRWPPPLSCLLPIPSLSLFISHIEMIALANLILGKIIFGCFTLKTMI